MENENRNELNRSGLFFLFFLFFLVLSVVFAPRMLKYVLKDVKAQVSCPLVSQPGRIIVDFAPYEGVRSDIDIDRAEVGPFAANIPAGNYNISLVAYDIHSGGYEQPDERYFLRLRNSSGAIFFDSNSTLDFPESVNYWQGQVNANAVIAQDVSSIIVRHSAYFDSSSPNSVDAVCAAFDPVDSGVSMGNWAWSPNIGWISFSSENCDADGDGFSDGLAGCPVLGTVVPPYGGVVNSATLDITGYVWSASAGWINLNPAGPYPGAPDYSSKIDGVTGAVTGWARALSYGGGWDGWIKMSGVSSGGSPYGVSLAGCSMTGFAWGDEYLGWISFSSKNCDADGNGFSDGSPAGCPPGGTVVPSYGVELDCSGSFLVPPTPVNFRVTNSQCQRIDFAWDDVAGETHYKIERSFDSNPFVEITPPGGLPADSVAFTDNFVSPFVDYSYKLYAISASGSSSPATLSATGACCSSFSMNSPAPISVETISGSNDLFTSKIANINVAQLFCGFNSPINLSVVSINGPGDSSGFVAQFSESGWGANSVLDLIGPGTYENTDFRVLVPGTAVAGTYIIRIKAEGGIYSTNIDIELVLKRLSPDFGEF